MSADRTELAPAWAFVQRVVDSWALPGLAVAVVSGDQQVEARGFGVQDVRTEAPVTPDTLFHLASVSKTFVATAVLRLVDDADLDLATSVTAYLPDLPWTDPRAGQITLRHLLSHTSGLGDVSDYGWHEPELDDGALARHAARVAGWRLQRDPGQDYAYSNAGFDLLGHLVATVGGVSFESHLKEHVLRPAGMVASTFVHAEVPSHLGAGPHLGLPPRVTADVYPYTRRHVPSSSLHSSAAELGRWMVLQLAGGGGLLRPGTHRLMWEPQVDTGGDELHAQMAHGWFCGTHRGHRVVSHQGADPGFLANVALVPDAGLGVALLANSNAAPVFGLTRGVLDVLLGHEAVVPIPPVTVPLGPVLAGSGVPAAVARYRRLQGEDPVSYDLDDGFEDVVWGAVEMHRTDLVRPVLELWEQVQPDSSALWCMRGWVDEVDGRPDAAVGHLRRALELDPHNEDASTRLRRLTG